MTGETAREEDRQTDRDEERRMLINRKCKRGGKKKKKDDYERLLDGRKWALVETEINPDEEGTDSRRPR